MASDPSRELRSHGPSPTKVHPNPGLRRPKRSGPRATAWPQKTALCQAAVVVASPALVPEEALVIEMEIAGNTSVEHQGN